MNVVHRRINPEHDKEYVLERHCRINYACDSPWAVEIPYEEYRANWYSWKSQIDEFWSHLLKTMDDPRTIAEIIENPGGEAVGYLWAPFDENKETGFVMAEIQDIYIEENFRRQGIAGYLLQYAEEKARQNGARVLRSGTGCVNTKSVALHRKMGFVPYRYEFEKEL